MKITDWFIDVDTNLPVKIQYKIEASTPGSVTMRDFRWNVETDPKLFDAAGAQFAFDADILTKEVQLVEKTIKELELVGQ